MSDPIQYLLDTNVLSETRKRHADERVIAFIADTDPSTLYLSVLTLGELVEKASRLSAAPIPPQQRASRHGWTAWSSASLIASTA